MKLAHIVYDSLLRHGGMRDIDRLIDQSGYLQCSDDISDLRTNLHQDSRIEAIKDIGQIIHAITGWYNCDTLKTVGQRNSGY